MRKLLLLMIALLAGVCGAWAQSAYEVTLGSQVTDLATLSSSKYYVLKNVGSSKYNYYDEANSQLDAKDDYDYTSVVKLNYADGNVTIQSVCSGTYYQGLSNNTRVAIAASSVNFTFNTDGVNSGQFRFANNDLYMNRYGGASQYPMGAATSFAGDYSRWNIYEVTITLASGSSVVNYSNSTGSYTATNAYNTWASKWESTATNPQVILSTTANNIKIADGSIWSGGGCTYTLTAQAGYVITGYSITGVADETMTLKSKEKGTQVSFTTGVSKTLSVSGLCLPVTSFTQSSPNKGIVISNFSVFLKPLASADDLSDLSNNKKYFITNNRGTWAVGSGATDVNSTVELDLAFSGEDWKQQFAIINYDDDTDDSNDGYYLYSVSEGKFAYVNGTKLSLTPAVGKEPTKVTFTASTNATYKDAYPVVMTLDDKYFGVHTGSTPDVYNYQRVDDAGNAMAILEAGSFDPTDALAILADCFHPTHTVTYIVNDDEDNELFNSGAIGAPVGSSVTAFPSEYYRDYFYTYGDITPVTITGESAANTNIEIVATPKSTAIKYTADATAPEYYNLNIRSKYLVYDDESTGDVKLQDTSEPFSDDASWAFIGNPYTGFKLINKANGTNKYLTYTSIVTGNNAGNNNVQFVDAGDFTDQYWYVESNTGGICLRMKANMAIYFHHDNSYHFLRTCSSGEYGAVHNDAGSTIVFGTDEDYLFALNDYMQSITIGSGVGQCQTTDPSTLTNEEAVATIASVDAIIAAGTTSAYPTAYATLVVVKNKLAAVAPEAGFYRLKNVATGKYLTATATASSYSDTNKYVLANGNATDASTVIRLFDKDSNGTLYMYNQGYGFGWTSTTNGGHVAWITSSPDKYVHWFPGTGTDQIAFAICYGNGVDTYSSYLKRGIHTVNANEEVIAGADDAVDEAQWVIEEATSVTVNMHSDGAEPATYFATFCAPFSYTVSDGTTAYTLAESGDYLVPTPIDGEVTAGTPVLLKGTSATATLTIGTGYQNSTPLTTTSLTGAYLAKTIDGATDYVLGMSGDVVGFYHWDSNDLAANRAYIDTPAEVKGFVINWGDVDGINSVQGSGFKVQDSEIYNLAGQRMSRVQKGINIVNGKKVLVK